MKKFKSFYEEVISEVGREEMPTANEVFEYLSQYFPDNRTTGSIVDHWGLYGNKDVKNKKVTKILLCTTAGKQVIKMFKEGKYDLLVMHHDTKIKPNIPVIIFHTTMDTAVAGHNGYFAKKFGMTDVVQEEYSVEGEIWKELGLEEFMQLLEKRGFKIDGLVWENKEQIEKYGKGIKRIIYCAGMGGMLIDPSSLSHMKWEGKKGLDMRNVQGIDAYITGELTDSPENTPNNFKYIIELGHANSEKPLFKWMKVKLQNRWQNLIIDLAPNEIEYQFANDKSGMTI